ncbi:osmoprotectant transport system permease protein [Deinococcus reticulitermitis]|uniref:Osmoprotectant transport system permease protein n=1 Tax=Deinococcus reticulitermitis TaxID=856736 RepID=A0A1H6XVT2_9DEIO|nr:ABC transporter permease [Deinococcus reticulitermitis]SEJ33149.1 osmoprotectant transport system permease protein [Deinococcus reticulitermitis]
MPSALSRPASPDPPARPALVRPVLLTACVLGLVACALPWVNFRANRLVLGEGRTLAELALAGWALLPLGWAALLACGWLPAPAQRWLAPVLYGGAAYLGSRLLGEAASGLTGETNPFARVSPASGAWLTVAALYVAGFAVSRVWRPAPLLGALAFVLPALLGGWSALGPVQEYRNVADTFWPQLGTHIALSLIALALAAVLGLPLGVVAARNERLAGAVLGGASFLQTIPSVALFGLALPIFSALGRGVSVGTFLAWSGGAALLGWGLTRVRPLALPGGLLALLGGQGLGLLLGLGVLGWLGGAWLGGEGLSAAAFSLSAPLSAWGVRGIGAAPALFALTLYALLPIVVNTFVGLRSVPAGIPDAARGLGMTPGQVLWRAELPVALPYVLEGLRSALVLTFGLTTVAALIGAGGLGFFIQRGVEGNVPDLVLLGAIPIVGLALLLSEGFGLLGRWLTPRGLRADA